MFTKDAELFLQGLLAIYISLFLKWELFIQFHHLFLIGLFVF